MRAERKAGELVSGVAARRLGKGRLPVFRGVVCGVGAGLRAEGPGVAARCLGKGGMLARWQLYVGGAERSCCSRVGSRCTLLGQR